MTPLLIDSHILLWMLKTPERLGERTHALLSDAAVPVHVSTATYMELAFKHREGKLAYSTDELREGARSLDLIELPLTPEDVVAVATLPLPHGDPFDIMLLAQASARHMSLVTADRVLLRAEKSALDART